MCDHPRTATVSLNKGGFSVILCTDCGRWFWRGTSESGEDQTMPGEMLTPARLKAVWG